MEDLHIKDYTYELPDDRIAAFPLTERDRSRLLVFKDDAISDQTFSDLPDLLPVSSLLVLNNSKVIHARMFFQKESGAVIEIFCLEPFQPSISEQAMAATSSVQWRCLIGGASKWKHGLVLEKKLSVNGIETILDARYISKGSDDFIIEFTWQRQLLFADVLKAAGTVPLPPYIKRTVEAHDAERYQTVFAKQEGSVAAPTASLHFTENIFERLEKKNVQRTHLSLHVGAGTFKPVKSETIAGHQMHAESFSISSEALREIGQASSIIAAGTTALRALESLYWIALKIKNGDDSLTLGQWEAYEIADAEISYSEAMKILLNYLEKTNEKILNCRTALLIRPGYQFRSAKALITNFHQPGSTLLLLVAAFIGDAWKKVYEHALNNNYRFLSYGDSSLLWRK